MEGGKKARFWEGLLGHGGVLELLSLKLHPLPDSRDEGLSL